jgi:signal transduction histidine kinase
MASQSSELILIIDDTPANLDVISDTLTDAGFEVAIARTGERALKQLQHQLPDLILLDVMMPGISGFEVCRQLKADARTQDIPILFMTALSDTGNKVKGFELGAVDYITKPFQEVEVLARVRTHLQLRKLARTLEQQVVQRTAALTKALEELQSSQMQLVQSEKMSALGNLVAGVAHEINNPLGFVSGNISHIENYLKDLLQLVDLYQQHYPDVALAIQTAIDAIDLEYLQSDVPKLINSTQEGIRRIRHISTSLRTFSRADSDHPVLFNLHEGIDSTLLILKHRLKASKQRPEIKVIKRYGSLPEVECYAGQMNQVFMNVLANAIDALENANQDHNVADAQANPRQITITTELSQDCQFVIIRIQDNGIGMTDAVKQKIFSHLFTTKEVGKGTGLGLAIAHAIVVQKHAGTLEVNSAPGEGAEFVITIPVHGATLQSCSNT